MMRIFFPTPPIRPGTDDDDEDREKSLARARSQLAEGRRQLSEAHRLTQPIATVASHLNTANSRNHFSEAIERMISDGYRGGRAEDR